MFLFACLGCELFSVVCWKLLILLTYWFVMIGLLYCFGLLANLFVGLGVCTRFGWLVVCLIVYCLRCVFVCSVAVLIVCSL